MRWCRNSGKKDNRHTFIRYLYGSAEHNLNLRSVDVVDFRRKETKAKLVAVWPQIMLSRGERHSSCFVCELATSMGRRDTDRDRILKNSLKQRPPSCFIFSLLDLIHGIDLISANELSQPVRAEVVRVVRRYHSYVLLWSDSSLKFQPVDTISSLVVLCEWNRKVSWFGTETSMEEDWWLRF